MSYLVYIALLGLAVIYFLWFRDIRIFARTGFPGYRTAAYHGVLHAALAGFGLGITVFYEQWDIFGLAVVLIGLYLQGKMEREKVWSNENTIDRMFGKAPKKI